MVKEIYIYVEGGGSQRRTQKQFQKGFGKFLAQLRPRPAAQTIPLRILACGSRESTFNDYRRALRSRPEALNLLLVDSEGPVSDTSPWKYLKRNDGWTKPKNVEDRHCHLMVQMMETWFVADREMLREFYGQGFQESALPKADDVEGIAKEKIAKALKKATRNTQKKTYDKAKHAPLILEKIRLKQVQEKAPHCRQFVETVKAEIDGSE